MPPNLSPMLEKRTSKRLQNIVPVENDPVYSKFFKTTTKSGLAQVLNKRRKVTDKLATCAQLKPLRNTTESSGLSVIDNTPSLAFTPTTESLLSSPGHELASYENLKQARKSSYLNGSINKGRTLIKEIVPKKDSPILINLVSDDSIFDYIEETNLVEISESEEFYTPQEQIRNKGYWNIRPDWVACPALPTSKKNYPKSVQKDNFKDLDNKSGVNIIGSSKQCISSIEAIPSKDLSLEPHIDLEYVPDYLKNLRRNEPNYSCDKHYMNHQDDLDWGVRSKLINWMLLFVPRVKLPPAVVFNAVNIFDRFLSQRKASRKRVSFIALICVSIASKYESQIHPTAEQFLKYSGFDTNKKDFIRSEEYILRVLDFKVAYPGPLEFLELAILAEDFHPQSHLMARFFLEICITSYTFIRFLPSMISSSAISLSRLVLSRNPWTPKLQEYTGYSQEEIKLCTGHMIDQLCTYLTRQPNLEKVCSSEFIDVAKLASQWITYRLNKYNLDTSKVIKTTS